uniref:Cytochrome b561 and DOMON domain-containing protein n=1 Tax=Hypericum perforatum TaxID=65561 RepID=D9ZHD2_HYPPE|nr:auxin response-like protein [Hypericum perforatum]
MLLLIFFFSISSQLFSTSSSSSSHCTTVTSTKTFDNCKPLPTQQASIAWTFHPHNATLDLCFSGNFISPSGWVGFGINPTSSEMTGTRALISFPDPNSGHLLLLPFVLSSSVKLQTTPLVSSPLDDHPVHVVSSSASLYGGKMATVHNGAAVQIFATLKLSPNKTKLHVVWNRGLYVQGYSPTIHPTTATDLSSFTTLDVLSGSSSNPKTSSSQTLKVIHGVVNSLSWGLLLPTGAITARYLRHVESLGATWFYVHAAIQLSGFLLGTVGFAMGVTLGDRSPGIVYSLHRKLGFAAFLLAALQTLALLFRPKTTNKFRKYWKSYHHFVGYACVVIGVVNVFQGFEVMGASRSYAKLGYCLCLSSLVGGCVAMEVNSWVVFCRNSKEEKMRREGLICSVAGSEKASGSGTHLRNFD